jgi:hypothetical protein
LTKHLCETFPIQNGLKQGDALLPLLFNFSLGCAISKAQENQVGLKINGTHQLLVYVHDVNLLEDNILTVKRNTETLADASEKVGLNTEKFKHMLMCRHQNIRQNHNTQILINPLRFGKVQILGTTVTNQNLN